MMMKRGRRTRLEEEQKYISYLVFGSSEILCPFFCLQRKICNCRQMSCPAGNKMVGGTIRRSRGRWNVTTRQKERIRGHSLRVLCVSKVYWFILAIFGGPLKRIYDRNQLSNPLSAASAKLRDEEDHHGTHCFVQKLGGSLKYGR